MSKTIRGKRGNSKRITKPSTHAHHKPRDLRGDLRPATARQRETITRWLNELKAKPREIERFTPGRSDSFWYAAKSGRWGNCRPTVQDFKDIKRIYDIGRVFVGKYDTLRNDALDLATQASRVTLSARKMLDDVMRVIGA